MGRWARVVPLAALVATPALTALVAITALSAPSALQAATAPPPPDPAAWQPIGPPGSSCDGLSGRRLRVGPGERLQRPSEAAAEALDGDVVLIAAGTWRGDVATWPQSRLSICAVGGPVHLHADGRHAGGKGIWVIRGRDVLVDGISFHGATVPDQNGAGIRAEGDGLTLRHTGFFDNQNGILGPQRGALTLQRAVFIGNGVGDPALREGYGYTHQLYAAGDRLTVLESLFAAGRTGHHIKSRARVTVVENSYLLDGPEGTASYTVDAAEGGDVLLRGNLMHKGRHAGNPTLVRFGAEVLSAAAPLHRLRLVHNTLVSDHRSTRAVVVRPGLQALHLVHNLSAIAGPRRALEPAEVADRTVSIGNRGIPREALPQADRLSAPDFWPAELAAQLALDDAPDPAYRFDAPQPRQARPLTALPGPRRTGALQAAP